MSVAAGIPVLRLSSGPLAGKVFEVHATLRVGRHPFNEISLGDPGLSLFARRIRFRAAVAVLLLGDFDRDLKRQVLIDSGEELIELILDRIEVGPR